MVCPLPLFLPPSNPGFDGGAKYGTNYCNSLKVIANSLPNLAVKEP